MRLIDADANIETMKKCAANPESEQALLCYRYTQRILEEAPTVEPASPWHRVEDELPNSGDWAIFTNGKVVSVERFKEDAYNHFFPASQWFDFEDAIAWMPLPELPKEDA